MKNRKIEFPGKARWPDSKEYPYTHKGIRRYYPDRNGKRFGVGDTVYLIPSMRIGHVRKVVVTAISGDDIYVTANLGCCGGLVKAHVYGCEVELR